MNQTRMPRYTGTKTLFARPMTRGDYNAYRGWDVPANEDPADPGYLVEYEDGGKANDSRHVGYISWSPADVFERTYKPVPAPTTTPTGPRVTPQDVTDAIASEHYFTAAEGVAGAARGGRITGEASRPLHLLTICVLVLRNGFTVVGTSACVSAENFDRDIGRKVARDDAVRQVWPLLGYLLKERQHRKAERTALVDGLDKIVELALGHPADYRDRVLAERERLNIDLEKLTAFLASEKVATVDAADLELLRAQAAAMTDYRDILDDRIKRFPGAPT